MSSFLMGCYDPDSKKWCTVTKCSGGYDDAMLARLQKELDMIKISKVREDPLTGCRGNMAPCDDIIKLISVCVAGPEQNPRLVQNHQELLSRFHHPQPRGELDSAARL